MRTGLKASVYPRVCGGTPAALHPVADVAGLSPRVRGNPRPTNRPTNWRRSIPACAGEPVQGNRRGVESGVYPRVCGGTRSAAAILAARAGLSPRVRGNHRGPVLLVQAGRSFPACAGEPRRESRLPGRCPVYPRVCGGTRHGQPGGGGVRGLSPRVRGNRRDRRLIMFLYRSIPACAGEPRDAIPLSVVPRVYPRVCGGTPVHLHPLYEQEGLSPRVRGNRRGCPSRRRWRRSIPACAGEPRGGGTGPYFGGVYPRVCGGTPSASSPRLYGAGLSPRVRGNRVRDSNAGACQRSIPACAGEPFRVITGRRRTWVYPRVCGGTRWWPTPGR